MKCAKAHVVEVGVRVEDTCKQAPIGGKRGLDESRTRGRKATRKGADELPASEGTNTWGGRRPVREGANTCLWPKAGKSDANIGLRKARYEYHG